jgi:hypothetical protein
MREVRWRYTDVGVPDARYLRDDANQMLIDLRRGKRWTAIGSGALNLTRNPDGSFTLTLTPKGSRKQAPILSTTFQKS